MTTKTTPAGIPVDLWDVLASWSQETFGSDDARGPLYPLRHLEREIQEAVDAAEWVHDAPNHLSRSALSEEISDCFLLILDAARRSGMSFQDLLDTSAVKLAGNMTRTWGKPDSEGVIEHDR